MKNDREVDTLAAFVHGALAFGHMLGFLYNARRRNTPQTVIHLGALVFDCYATYTHVKDVVKEEK